MHVPSLSSMRDCRVAALLAMTQIPLDLRSIPLSQGGLQALPPLSKGGAATAAVGFKKLKFYKEITDLTSFCHCERSEAISSCIFKLKSSLVIFLHALTLLLLNTVLLWLFLYYSEFRSFSVVISPAKPPEPYPTAHQRRSRRVVPRCLPPQHPVQCRRR